MFYQKTKQIKHLKAELAKIKTQNRNNQVKNNDEFLSILKAIQTINKENLQWKQRQSKINEAIEIAREEYINRNVELAMSND